MFTIGEQFNMIQADSLNGISLYTMTLLTVRQAAARLGVGYSTLKHWIYEGRVRTRVTSGGHHRIADAEQLETPLWVGVEPLRPIFDQGITHAQVEQARGQVDSATAVLETVCQPPLLTD